MPASDKSRRRFTEAAREAAAIARQRKREHRTRFPEFHQLVMVVVRAVDVPRAFAWQIRRFGHVEPVRSSGDVFLDPDEAARSGQTVLDDMRVLSATAAE